MEKTELMVNNTINKSFFNINELVNSLWPNVKSVISGNEPDKYDKAKEMVLDGGFEIMSYLGDVVKKIDEAKRKSEKNS